MTDEWGEPVAGASSAHDFESEPTLIGVYRHSDDVTVGSAEAGDLRTAKIHRFLTDESEQVDCWGSVDLDRKLRDINPGQLVRVQFLGRRQLDNGREMKEFEVRVAREHSVAAAQPAADDDIPF